MILRQGKSFSVSDVGLPAAYGMILVFIALLYCWAWYLLSRGIGIQS